MTTTTLTATLNGQHRHITRSYVWAESPVMGSATLRACRNLRDLSRFILVMDLGPGGGDVIERLATIEELRERWAVYHNDLIKRGYIVQSTEGIEPGA